MLYHPCAEPSEIIKLKKLVKSCLWKYVITPWNMLSREMVMFRRILFIGSYSSFLSVFSLVAVCIGGLGMSTTNG